MPLGRGMSWKLVIHGGCGAMRPETVSSGQEEQARAGMNAALDAGDCRDVHEPNRCASIWRQAEHLGA